MLKLYNTQSKKKEEFVPEKEGKVTIYQCGPTVYWYAHIGNMRSYIFGDILRKTLLALEYDVIYVMNVTDVGHLVSDADEGEDKMEKAAKKEGKTAKEIASFYTKAFLLDLKRLNIEKPKKLVKATEHIKEQIELIKQLESNGYTYVISDGVYFDTEKFSNYPWLLNVHSGEDSQERIVSNEEKKHKNDFALWKFSPLSGKRLQEWKSPWGVGFPGWHIECSAMALKYLKNPIDIHTGGIDLSFIHHPNEIAQAEAAGYKPFVTYWLHTEFVNLTNTKMAKSKENIVTVENIIAKNIDPLAYRYLVLNVHYRQIIQYSIQALTSAESAIQHLRAIAQTLPMTNVANETLLEPFYSALQDDVNTPKAVAVMWDVLKDDMVSPEEKRYFLEKVDTIFGLDINVVLKLPKSIRSQITLRDKARAEKRFKESDEIRDSLVLKGYELQDTPGGTLVIKKG